MLKEYSSETFEYSRKAHSIEQFIINLHCEILCLKIFIKEELTYSKNSNTLILINSINLEAFLKNLTAILSKIFDDRLLYLYCKKSNCIVFETYYLHFAD